VAIWHLLFLLPQWCFPFTPCGGAIGCSEMWIQLKCFQTSNWENLQEEFFLEAQALSTGSSSILFPQHDPPTHKRLLRNLALGYAGEYFCVIRTLAPFSLTPMSSDTTLILIALHFKSDGYFPLFIKDYELD